MSRIIANNIRHNDAASDSLSFDSSARVGIGTASPTEKLHLSGSGGTVILVADSSSYAGLSLSGSGSSNFIVSDDRLDFLVNGSTRASILTTGGLTFNGDTAAANALDDYEEGTWSPEIGINNSTAGITYTYQVGSYTKVGNIVQVGAYVVLSSKGSNTGTVSVRSLPFTSKNLTNLYVYPSVHLTNCTSTLTAAGVLELGPNTTSAAIMRNTAGGADYLADSVINSNFVLGFSFTYQAG